MAVVLPAGVPHVLLVGDEVRIAALGAVLVQREYRAASDLMMVTQAEALKLQLTDAIAAAVRHPFDGTCVTAGPFSHDLAEPDACRSLGISRSTFGRRARRLGLQPVERGRGRANRWRAADVERIRRG